MMEHWIVKMVSWWAQSFDWRPRSRSAAAASVCALLMFSCGALAVARASYWPSPGDLWPMLLLGCAAVAALAIVALIERASFKVTPPEPQEPRRVSLPSDPLENRAWLKLAEECVALFDEMDRHRADFDPQRRELAEHALFRLRELLERSGVEVISKKEPFDRQRHQAIAPLASHARQMAIVEVLSPGFAVRRRVLRRARVRLIET